MDEEELKSGKSAAVTIGGDLSMLSIDELGKRITYLEQEISRIKDDIAAKKSSKLAAESVFRS